MRLFEFVLALLAFSSNRGGVVRHRHRSAGRCRQAAGFSDNDFSVGTVLDIHNFRGKDKLIAQGV